MKRKGKTYQPVLENEIRQVMFHLNNLQDTLYDIAERLRLSKKGLHYKYELFVGEPSHVKCGWPDFPQSEYTGEVGTPMGWHTDGYSGYADYADIGSLGYESKSLYWLLQPVKKGEEDADAILRPDAS